MSRPFIRVNSQQKTAFGRLQSKPNQQNDLRSQFSPNERLLQSRSSLYVQQMSEMDLGEKTLSDEKIGQIMNTIQLEFPDLPEESQPVGIVAACHLGQPYEVHTLDLHMEKIVHYRANAKLPANFEKARSLALHPSYAFIEVYPHSVRAIEKSGEVSVVEDS